MNNRASNKILAFTLTAAMLLTLAIPGEPLATTAYAADIGAGATGFHDPVSSSPSTYQTVYYGTNPNDSNSPIAWRVLDVSGGEVFLLAESNMNDGVTEYNNWRYGQGTNPRDWLTADDGLPSGFTDAELASISKQKVLEGTTVQETAVADGSGDPFFLLSKGEAENTSYFPAGNTDRATGDAWWLRSPSHTASLAAFVNNNGPVYADDDSASTPLGIR